MDLEKTRAFYSRISSGDVCGCAYCQNYVRQIRAAYPQLGDYLSRLGVDMEKPLETMPLEPDEAGKLEYAGPQYIVCGTPEGFTETQIGSVRIEIAASHPSTGVEEPNFMIELYPIRLKWAESEQDISRSWNW